MQEILPSGTEGTNFSRPLAPTFRVLSPVNICFNLSGCGECRELCCTHLAVLGAVPACQPLSHLHLHRTSAGQGKKFRTQDFSASIHLGFLPRTSTAVKKGVSFYKKDLAHILACVLRSICLDTRWTQCSLLAVAGGIPGCHPVPSATRTSPPGQGAAGGGAYQLSDARFPAIFISGREVWIKRAMQRTLGSIM